MIDLENSLQWPENLGVTLSNPLEKLLEANAVPNIEVDTPIGPIQVFLAGPNELLGSLEENSPEWKDALRRLSMITRQGILAEYLKQYGVDKGPTQNLSTQTIDSEMHPVASKVEPTRMVLTNYLFNASGVLFMAYVDVAYRQQQPDGSWQNVERKVHFRPDSATTLVEIISESGKRFIMLNIAWKEGVGGTNFGEASAGSMDHGDKNSEGTKELALREVNEEIGLSEAEIARAIVREVFTDQTVSPGGYSERISGYHLTLMLSDARIQELLENIHGVDANEHISNQLIPIELPEVPNSLTAEFIAELTLTWQNILAQTQDLKTRSLIQQMWIEEMIAISNRLATVDQ